MRARTARHVNRAIIATAIAALSLTGAGVAKADVVDDYTAQNAGIVCTVLDNHTSVEGVEGVAIAIIDEGFSPAASGEIVARSVIGWCPRHAGLIQGFIAKWGDSSTAKSRSKAA